MKYKNVIQKSHIFFCSFERGSNCMEYLVLLDDMDPMGSGSGCTELYCFIYNVCTPFETGGGICVDKCDNHYVNCDYPAVPGYGNMSI